MGNQQSSLNAALLLRSILYCLTRNKLATRIPTGYGPRAAKHFFDGKESKYELWEGKFLGHLRIQHLYQIILSPTDQRDDTDFVEKNATVFAELIQYLDDKSDKRCMRQWRKSLNNIKGTLFIKRKAKSHFLLYKANIFEKIGIRVYYRLYNKDREYF